MPHSNSHIPIAQRSLKIAIVADWLTNPGGAEKVVLALAKAFPGAPIFTSVYDAAKMPGFEKLDIRTTYLQKLPTKIRNRHQLFPLLRANAFRRLDLSEYDVIISSASAEAKAVVKRPDAVHICYCHTPTRYYWSHYKDYVSSPGFGLLNPAVRVALPILVGLMRRIDLRAVAGVDHFIANSHEVQKRIKTHYNRDSTIIYPPVDINRMRPKNKVKKEDYYLVVGRQIPYKRIDLAIAACTKLGRRLVVIGRGSEHDKLRAMAGPTIEFKYVDSDSEIVEYFQKAKGFIFTSEEDFGITPVEAMAAGTPIIAFARAGALDYIQEGINGVGFHEQTVEAVVAAIERFENSSFDTQQISHDAKKFDQEKFISDLQAYVVQKQPQSHV